MCLYSLFPSTRALYEYCLIGASRKFESTPRTAPFNLYLFAPLACHTSVNQCIFAKKKKVLYCYLFICGALLLTRLIYSMYLFHSFHFVQDANSKRPIDSNGFCEDFAFT